MAQVSVKTMAFAAVGAVALCTSAVVTGMPGFGTWSAPVKVNSGVGSAGPINTGSVDGCVTLSRDGLDIYFTSMRSGKFQLYTAHRSSTALAFGPPQRLPDTINAENAACPSIIGRNTLYFIRAINGDPGDIYVSHRSSGDWGPAVAVDFMNSELLDETVAAYEDEQGREVLMWSSRNQDGSGGVILQYVEGGDVELVPGSPNEVGSNNRASITHDGLTIFFDSVRPGGLGGPDLYYATREHTSDPFGPAVHLESLSSPGFDARPWIIWNGTQLFFSSNREGSTSPAPDVWMASRNKSSGPNTVDF